MKQIFKKIIPCLFLFFIFSISSVYSASYKKERDIRVTIKNELNFGFTAVILEYTTNRGCGPFSIWPERESHNRFKVFGNTLRLILYLNKIKLMEFKFTVNDSNKTVITIKPSYDGISLVIQ